MSFKDIGAFFHYPFSSKPPFYLQNIDRVTILEIIAQNRFDDISRTFLSLSFFIRWIPRKAIHAIIYNSKNHIVISKAGIAIIIFVSSCGKPFHVDFRTNSGNYNHLQCSGFINVRDEHEIFKVPTVVKILKFPADQILVATLDGNSMVCEK